MGGRGNQHRINVWPGQDLAKIIVSLAGFVAALPINFGIMIVYAFGRPLAPITPDIADREDLHLFSARVSAGHVSPGAAEQMTTALRADPDKPHGDAFARREGSVSTQH